MPTPTKKQLLMPTLPEKLPPLQPETPKRPPSVLGPATLDVPDWEELDQPCHARGTEDSSRAPSVVDDFNNLATAHAEAMLSKVLMEHRSSISKLKKEHQSSIFSMQSEIASLQEKLGNPEDKPPPDNVGCQNPCSNESSPTRSKESSPKRHLDPNVKSLICNAGTNANAGITTNVGVVAANGYRRSQSWQSGASMGSQGSSPKRRSAGANGFVSEASRGSRSKWPGWLSETSNHNSWGDILRKVNNPRFSLMRRMKVLEASHGTSATLDKDHMSRLRRFILGNHFEILSGCVILANTLVMAMQQQYHGLDIGHSILPGKYSERAELAWPGAEDAFTVLDIIFTICFCIELALRLYAHRLESLRIGWMYFDVTIVSLGLVDTVTAGTGGLGFDPTMIRLIRLFRLARLFKIFKAMESFDALFLLLKSIHASVGALMWSFLLLVGVQIASALLLGQLLQSFIEDSNREPVAREKIFKMFGTFSRAMVTMFEITLASWVPSCRLLMEEVHETFFLFYLVYRCMFCFSVMRVIAAVFIAETNRVLAGDVELTLMKAQKEKMAYKSKLESVFTGIDHDGNGTISWNEMQMFLTDAEMSAWLATVGFNRTDFEKLFWLIEESGCVQTDRFLGMVDQLKGQAKTVDLLTMFKIIHKMDRKLQKIIHTATTSSAAHTQHVIAELEDDVQEKALFTLGEGSSLTHNELDQVIGDTHIR